MKKTRFIAETALSCAFIIICSFISVPMGAVPITLQTLAVTCISGIFGLKTGILSVLLYIFSGALGLPVFHAGQSDFGILLGPTGGYIIGFIGIAALAGLHTKNDSVHLFILHSVIGHLICYAVGSVWFAVFSENSIGLLGGVVSCVVPFIIPDAVKIIISTLIVKRLRPVIRKRRADSSK